MKLRILLLVLFTCGIIAACGTGHKAISDARTPAGSVSNPSPPENRLPQKQFIQCPEGMRPGIDYRPDEIIVGFKLDGFSSPSFATGKVPFNKGAMLNPILYENEAIAEFAREIEINRHLAIIPNGEGYVKNVNFCAYKLTPNQDVE